MDARLSEHEVKVLRATSTINKVVYVPFIPADLNEPMVYANGYTDPETRSMKLAPKQRASFVAFKRASEIMKDPQIIVDLDCTHLRQTVVSDCSFVSSCAVAAQYEKKFNKPLISSIIYPQKNGKPIYNPYGKYMIKLIVNGVTRKITIDDYLPYGRSQLLCSYSNIPNELWISLLEKAYMKMMGGYDFPGSNSNTDLHALTGWIPERLTLNDKDEFNETNAIQHFDRLMERFHIGHCLITVVTGKMTDAEENRTGLIDSHCYAVIDMRKIGDLRLFKLKNPWCHIRWKGNFSDSDKNNWTPRLRQALNFDPQSAASKDDGIFWIDYKSFIHFFGVLYINWDPKLFRFDYELHDVWLAGQGPVRDLFSCSNNPQYYLEVNNKLEKAAVWILLTRHITEIDDFANNKEYIALNIYNGGEKIYVPFFEEPILNGVRINSNHFLAKLTLTKKEVHKFSLVVVQYEKTATIFYTLKVFSVNSFVFRKMPNPYVFQKKEKGEWKGKTAGGCGKYDRETVKNNPIYHITLNPDSDDHDMVVMLLAPREFSIGMDFFQVSSVRGKAYTSTNSGDYRKGTTMLRLNHLPAGVYGVRPMTFQPKMEGPFILNFECTSDPSIKRVQ